MHHEETRMTDISAQLETPEQLLRAIWDFAEAFSAR